MKRAVLFIFVALIFVRHIFAEPQLEQVLTRQTIEKIIEHRLDIFELLYKSRIYNYTFSFLQDYYIHNKPAHEWPNVETIKHYYNEAINIVEPGDLSLDDNFMNNYIKMAEDFSDLDEEIDSVDTYNILIMYCNGYLMENQNYGPYNDFVQEMIQQVFNSEESDVVTQLFNKYNIENAFHKFVIASTIVQILIYEKLFLRELPEIEEYIKNDLGYWIDYDTIDPYLKNVKDLLQSFNDRDIKLVRSYMDLIVERTLEDVK
jgi:hypothetical protein